MSERQKRLGVLLIEDNKGDIFLIGELLRDTGLDVSITVAENGQLALAMLKRMAQDGTCVPDFVILDLNLPKVHGFDVLAYMKGAEPLHAVPVAVMTGSLNREDEVKARSMGVVDYRIKPSGREDFNATGVWLKKSLESLAHRRQERGREGTSGAAMMHLAAGRRVSGRPELDGWTPSSPKCPMLGDWNFNTIGRAP
jgi:CheY-like chemotaxis protein